MKQKIKTSDVVFVYVEYEDKQDGKKRPALVLKMNHNKMRCFKITSRFNNSRIAKEAYYKIINWLEAGLNKPSFIDTHRVIDIDLQYISSVRKFGQLSDYDLVNLEKFIKNK